MLPPPQNNEDIGLLDGSAPPPDMPGCPACGCTPNTISINPDSVAIDGEPPAPGDTFIAQVEFTATGLGPDGKLQSVATKINDEPVDGSPEPEAPDADDDDSFDSPDSATANA